MKEIVGVTFEKDGRIYYVLTNNFQTKIGYNVIVNTDKGLQFAKVATEPHKIDVNKLDKELNEIFRIASKQDYYNNNNNIREAKEAFKRCQSLVKKYKLDMRILDAAYTFDKDQLIFKFYSDNRIDFRELAKELANIYHTRIELRQIGVRDKAKEVGGVGLCGQKLCCARFLNNFDSVSIAMAKNQNLSLSPSKINGVCGRLLCCLKYEDDCYKKCKKELPSLGQTIKLNEGEGKVISIDILKNTYKVHLNNGNIIEVSNGSSK